MFTLIITGIATVIGALLLHEATHALTAVAIPGVRIERVALWPTAYVEAWVPEGHPTATDGAIALAPTLIGFVGGAIYVAVNGWPSATPQALLGVMGWALYSGCSTDDLAGAAPSVENIAPTANIVRGLSIMVVAGVLVRIGWGTPLQTVGFGVALAGTAVLVLSASQIEAEAATV